jgi:Protein of unknown function (DUF3443)
MTRRGRFLVVICAGVGVWAGCGGGASSSNSNPAGGSNSGGNVQAVSVNGGPNGNYANGLFTSVTVCVPGSSNCQAINDVLVDTGSYGLRILSSALTLSLPQQTASSGNAIAECVPFMASLTWGPVEMADIHIAGESASSVPIQVLSDTAFPLPTQCKNRGLPTQDTLQTLGANGILGIGIFPQDCGTACTQTASNPGVYYACTSSSCLVTTESVSAQVQNPVPLFANDNNGVLIELPSVSGPEASLSGSLIFGIGTQSNNSLGSAKVYTLNPSNVAVTTTFQSQAYSNSFLDSGSNALFFPSTIPQCTKAKGFYCPASTENLSATITGANNASAPISFSVGNAEILFANPGDAVFNDLAGPASGVFDWGLPFFFGRNVFTAIDGAATPGGQGPYWAF